MSSERSGSAGEEVENIKFSAIFGRAPHSFYDDIVNN